MSYRTYIKRAIRLSKESIPKRRTLRDLFESILKLAVLPGFDRNVGHRNHADQVIVVINHWNTSYLFVSHLSNDINYAIVWFRGVNIDRHNVFPTNACTILVICNRSHYDITVSD